MRSTVASRQACARRKAALAPARQRRTPALETVVGPAGLVEDRDLFACAGPLCEHADNLTKWSWGVREPRGTWLAAGVARMRVSRSRRSERRHRGG
jgi:hypothetical protein